MPGPAPKPVQLHIIRGNPSKKSLKRNPTATRGYPECPRGFSAAFNREWNLICKELDEMGIITKADRGIIVGYCEAYAEFVQSVELVKKQGTTLISAKTGSIYTNPNVNVKNAAADRMVKIAAQLGLSPSARTRITVNSDKPNKDDLESFAASRR